MKIWYDLKQEYINAQMICQVDPTAWIRNNYPKEGNEVIHSLMIEGKLTTLENCFETAKRLYTPETVFQSAS